MSSPIYHYEFFAMGTRFDLTLPDVETSHGDRLAEAIERQVLLLEKRMSRFQTNGFIAKINRTGRGIPIRIDEEYWKIISRCHEAWQKTGGAFDVSVLPLTQLWWNARYSGPNRRPAPAALEEAVSRSGFQYVDVNPRHRTITFLREGIAFDFTSFRKGHAVDQVVASLREQEVTSAFINFGDGVIAGIGAQPSGEPWTYSPVHLFKHATPIHTFTLQDDFISLSGTAPFDRPQGEVRYGHMVSPLTCEPIPGYRILAAKAGSATDAAIVSVACLIHSPDERDRVIDAFPDTTATEFSFPDPEACEIAWRSRSTTPKPASA